MKADDFLFLEVSLQSENCDVNFISKKLMDILYDCSQTVFGLNANTKKKNVIIDQSIKNLGFTKHAMTPDANLIWPEIAF